MDTNDICPLSPPVKKNHPPPYKQKKKFQMLNLLIKIQSFYLQKAHSSGATYLL